MGFLDFIVLGVISGAVLAAIIVAIAAIWLYLARDEQGTTADRDRQLAWVIVIIGILLIAANFWSGMAASTVPPPGSSHTLTGALTLGMAACPSFSGVSFSLNCNTGTVNTLNNGTSGGVGGITIASGLFSKYSTNALYAAQTTTAVNELSFTFTVRRTDADINDAQCTGGPCKATVSFAISTPSSWSILSNASTMYNNKVYILAQDVYGNFQEGWTDTNSNFVIGENGGALMSLLGNGGSGTVKFSLVLNSPALPRDVPFSKYQFTATITVTMALNLQDTAVTPLTWTIPLNVNYQASAS